MSDDYNPDPRAFKRWMRKQGMSCPIKEAYDRGGYAAEFCKPKRNPYPAGRRHDAYDHGYASADPMGDYHGRNR